MVTTCFFCQSMLSDYLENLLPSNRQDEIKEHIASCKQCTEVQRDLQSTMDLAHGLTSKAISHETALRITEACHAGTRRFSSNRASRWAFMALVPILLFGSAAVLFPEIFPWVSRIRVRSDESSYVRYFPILEGAGEIVEEHGNWLHVREPAMRSLWEEGGISPEEFEKSFTGKPNLGEEVK